MKRKSLQNKPRNKVITCPIFSLPLPRLAFLIPFPSASLAYSLLYTRISIYSSVAKLHGFYWSMYVKRGSCLSLSLSLSLSLFLFLSLSLSLCRLQNMRIRVHGSHPYTVCLLCTGIASCISYFTRW